MKFLLAFLFVGIVTAETSEFFSRVKRDTTSKTCVKSAEACCSSPDGEESCNSACSSLILEKQRYDDFSAYANENLARSFEYLFLSAQFGTFLKDRPGFHKVFNGLADNAWNKGIEMIKEASKRGVEHNFKAEPTTKSSSKVPKMHDTIVEIQAMATAAEIEKDLLIEANRVHRHHSHASTVDTVANEKGYDAALSHYLDEEIIEAKTETVRNLVGHVNDLMRLAKKNNGNLPLSLYLFDQYLQK